MVLPYILFFCAFVVFKGETNQIMSIISIFVIIFINFLYIQNKTDFYVAFGSTLIWIFFWVFIGAIAFGNSLRNNNYYYR